MASTIYVFKNVDDRCPVFVCDFLNENVEGLSVDEVSKKLLEPYFGKLDDFPDGPDAEPRVLDHLIDHS